MNGHYLHRYFMNYSSHLHQEQVVQINIKMIELYLFPVNRPIVEKIQECIYVKFQQPKKIIILTLFLIFRVN